MGSNPGNVIALSNFAAASAAAAKMQHCEITNSEISAKNRLPAKARKRVILSAEHHLDTSEMLVILLGFAGYEVRDVCSEEDALRLAATEAFDLYLVGDLLPHGSNLELVKRIRNFNSNTPLIFHSSRAFSVDIVRGLSVGAQAYLVKPCDPDHLLNTIRRYINRRVAQSMQSPRVSFRK